LLYRTYPSTPPRLSLEHRLGMREFPTPVSRGAAAADTASRLRGSPMIYDLVTAVTQNLEECPVPRHTDDDDRHHLSGSAAVGKNGVNDDDDTDSDHDGGAGLRRPGANAAAVASAAAGAVAVPRRSRTTRSS
ncbi:hypothetical protein HK405_002145, partial [Cladochytrium tenue]